MDNIEEINEFVSAITDQQLRMFPSYEASMVVAIRFLLREIELGYKVYEKQCAKTHEAELEAEQWHGKWLDMVDKLVQKTKQ